MASLFKPYVQQQQHSEGIYWCFKGRTLPCACADSWLCSVMLTGASSQL